MENDRDDLDTNVTENLNDNLGNELSEEEISQPIDEGIQTRNNNNNFASRFASDLASGYGGRHYNTNNELKNVASDDEFNKNKNNANQSNNAANNLATGKPNPNTKNDKNDKNNKNNKKDNEKTTNKKNEDSKQTANKKASNGQDNKEKSGKKNSLKDKLNPLKGKKDSKKKSGKGAGAAIQEGIKNIWKRLPMSIKFGVIAAAGFILLLVVFLVLLIILLGSSSDNGSGSSYCTESSVDISDLVGEGSKSLQSVTVMALFEFRWNKTASSWEKFYSKEEIYTDEDNFLRSDDAYVVALGSAFGSIGSRFVVTLKDGKTFTIVKGDEKSDSDSNIDEQHRYHKAGEYYNILEFIFGCGTTVSNPKEYGFKYTGSKMPAACDHSTNNNKAYELVTSDVVSIDKINGDSDCNFEGGFYQRTASIYTDQSAIDKILQIAPGVKGNYDESLRYECVTYAKLRAVEIINTATNYNANQRKKALAEIGNAQGNGWQFTPNDIGNGVDWSGFSSDKTCSNFQPGSIIAFSGSGATCETNSPETGRCGHVAIIEKVDNKKQRVTLSDSYNPRGWAIQEYSFTELKNSFGGCRGITYLLSYNG